MTTKLSLEQVQQFHKDGYLLVENAISHELLERLNAQFSSWVDESRAHQEPFGEMLDGRPRFDIEPEHSAELPALRRVSSPIEISNDYLEAMRDSTIADLVSELIGPDIKYHHCKINSKLPGAKTSVKFHQDFPFTPHTNDSLITALLFIDDVTEMNGALEVVPGSHKGPLYSLWHDGIFTGAISEETHTDIVNRTQLCTGKAGSVCLMHTRLLHGSAPNLSEYSRTLYICVYSAADAYPLTPNPVPSDFEQAIIRGSNTTRIRCTEYQLERPQLPTGASFFTQQAES